MRTYHYTSYVVSVVLFLCVMALAGCGGEEEGVRPVLAPGEEKVESQVALRWEQVGDTQLKVLSSNTFRTGAGEYVYLVGEVENTGDRDLGNVSITARAYDDGGKVVDTRNVDVLLSIVKPGGKIPYSGAMDAREVARYELEAQGQPVDAKPANTLEVADVSMTDPKAGYVWFEGAVKNVGDVAATAIRVVAVLYNDKGEVVEAKSQELKETLAPGDAASFKFIANHRGAASYELFADAMDAD